MITFVWEAVCKNLDHFRDNAILRMVDYEGQWSVTVKNGER